MFLISKQKKKVNLWRNQAQQRERKHTHKPKNNKDEWVWNECKETSNKPKKRNHSSFITNLNFKITSTSSYVYGNSVLFHHRPIIIVIYVFVRYSLVVRGRRRRRCSHRNHWASEIISPTFYNTLSRMKWTKRIRGEKKHAQQQQQHKSSEHKNRHRFHQISYDIKVHFIGSLCVFVRRVVLCSNHFCFSVNNFRYRNYVYISFTCSEHNNRTYNKTTIMKIEIKTWGSREFSISLFFSLFVCPFLPCVRSVFHIYTIQIDAQRKQWRKMRGYKIHLRILKKKNWNEIKWMENL